MRIFVSKKFKALQTFTGREDGSAIVIALLVMVLLMGFVVLAISRTNSETISAGNDAAETKAFDASHASLEVMTRNFNKIFEVKLNPDPADLANVESQVPPGFDDYDFSGQRIIRTDATQSVVMTEGQFQGLTALRDGWRLDSPAIHEATGVQVTLSRRFFNNRIPIFQFGIFYEDDLEFHPGPRFDFGGRVHSNGSIFLAANTRLNFSSKVTAHDHIFTDVQKNDFPWSNWGDQVYIKDASGVFRRLFSNEGSVLKTVPNGSPVTDNPLPTTYRNANWETVQARYQGNLLAYQKTLELPIKLNANINGNPVSLREIVKRTKSIGDVWNDGTGTDTSPNVVAVNNSTKDDLVTASERYANKTGIRIHLADSKAKLPGCATSSGAAVTTPCGVRLDGSALGDGSNPVVGQARGYQPQPMTGPTYSTTRLNGERFHIPGREVWIKIDTVAYDPTTQTHGTNDITADILALGITEQAPTGLLRDGYTTGSDGTDGRAIVKLQRFVLDGVAINNSHGLSAPNNYIYVSGTNNYVLAARVSNTPATNTCATAPRTVRNGGLFTTNGHGFDATAQTNQVAHMKTSNVTEGTGTYGCMVPFPIKMFDTREGLFNDTTSVFNPTAAGNYGSAKVPWAGVMSIVDIDVNNLRRFLRGDFDGGVGVPGLPATTPFAVANGRPLRSTDIPDANGWVLYFSDRRGDFDFDGEYDMEDIFGNTDGILQPGEDVNFNGVLDRAGLTTGEAIGYTGTLASESADIAAVFDHKFYRRGLRLINGTRLPGVYDSAAPNNTKGFTVASENAVYVKGNYNATGVASYGTPTPAGDYLPQNTSEHIPASVAADAVMILSNAWSDARSFRYPFSRGNRVASETTVRFAILTDDSLSSLNGTPNQGGGDPRMSGGVHNFKRFLEDWGGSRLNYSGSLINLFNAANNNGAFKCCDKVYGPPNRNWVFDTTFLNADRIPPGTPFFQSIQITGFERRN